MFGSVYGLSGLVVPPLSGKYGKLKGSKGISLSGIIKFENPAKSA